jgi:hypothetical protein
VRLADLFWLLAHRGRGSARLGDESYGLGLAAAVVAESLVEPSSTVDVAGMLCTDAVLASLNADVASAAGKEVVRPVRPWIEWLAAERHERTERAVVSRLSGAGLVEHRRWRPAPVDYVVADAPVTLLLAVLNKSVSITDQVRLLAGLAVSCGLVDEVSSPGIDPRFELHQLTRRLPAPLSIVLTGLDDALHALAVRRG